MASARDLAAQYAQRIIGATANSRRIAKSMGASATPPRGGVEADLRAAVRRVLSDIDGLRDASTGQPITVAEINELLELVDDSVDVPRGTFVQIRKSSIASALQFEAAIALLYDAIVFK